MRELREESGLSVDADRLVFLGESVVRAKRNLLFAVVVDAECEPAINHESQDWAWVSLDVLTAHRRLHAPTAGLAPALRRWGKRINERLGADPADAEQDGAALPRHLTWDWLLRHVPQVWPFRRDAD